MSISSIWSIASMTRLAFSASLSPTGRVAGLESDPRQRAERAAVTEPVDHERTEDQASSGVI
jgi:hypothetical protein